MVKKRTSLSKKEKLNILPPSPEEILKDVNQASKSGVSLTHAEESSINYFNKQAEYKQWMGLRKIYGIVLLFVIGLILLFEIGLSIAVGRGKLHFTDDWFLRLIILGGFSEMILLVKIVVEALFPKDLIQQPHS